MASRGHIQLEIYRDTEPQTLVDVIDARVEPQYLSELKNHGAGSFKVSKLNKKILANPSLLDYRNIVRVRLMRGDDSDPILGAFLIQTKKTVIVGAGEAAEAMWEISGEGLRSWFKDASVFPATGLKSNSKESRYFNFAAERGTWYKPADWVAPIELYTWNSPGNWWGTAPSEWPDAPDAKWLGGMGREVYNHPIDKMYFRYEFQTTGTYQYSFFFAVDDSCEVYVDGELMVNGDGNVWEKTSRLDFALDEGPHIIGVKTMNSPVGKGPTALLGALYKVGDPLVPSSAQLINVTSASTWKVNPFPAEEPGWTPGEVIRTLVEEAELRGVRFASTITFGFSDVTDSAGNSWTRRSWDFDIGASYSDVLEALEETECDVYLDPDTLMLYAWRKRGFDLSKDSGSPNPIVFSRGHNLLAGDETGQAQITNSMLLRSADGWQLVSTQDSSSVTKYGVIENQLSTELSAVSAVPLVNEVFRQRALPERAATFEVFAVAGMMPFLDFGVGDYVSAPNENNVQEDRRVMSISISENTAGAPVYTVEFDFIFKDRQTELEKQVNRGTGGGSAGSGMPGAGGLPDTVITLPPGNPPIAKTPDRPEWVVYTSTGSWNEVGSARSSISLQWTAVNTSNQSPITDITGYELWGWRTEEGATAQRILATPIDTYATLTDLLPEQEWNFFVRAVSRTAGPGQSSPEIVITTEAPIAPLSAPSKPTLRSDLGAVVVAWDGLLGGAPAPAHYKQMIIQRAAVGSSTWKAVSTFQSVAGQDNSGIVGESYQYRLVALDYLNNPSAPSSAETITVKGVSVGQVSVGAIVADNIAANAVTAVKLANGAVTQAKISPGAVGSNEIQDFALTAKKFNTNRHMLF